MRRFRLRRVESIGTGSSGARRGKLGRCVEAIHPVIKGFLRDHLTRGNLGANSGNQICLVGKSCLPTRFGLRRSKTMTWFRHRLIIGS